MSQVKSALKKLLFNRYSCKSVDTIFISLILGPYSEIYLSESNTSSNYDFNKNHVICICSKPKNGSNELLSSFWGV